MIANGVDKFVRYKKQTQLGTLPGTSGGQALRRLESLLELAKQTYESAEKASHAQVQDFRHGFQRAEGPIRGELSPATYLDFMAGLLRRDFTAVTSITGASFTIAASGSLWTVTRAAGSYLTDGLKVGNVVRLTAGAFNAANLNKNLLVVELTGTVATVLVLNGSALVAEGPIASATMAIPGKKTFTPATGRTNDYFTIEHYFSDLDETELFVDCRPGSMGIALPPTGIATIDWGFLGRSFQSMSGGAAPYFTSPAAETLTGLLTGVDGALVIGGTPVATLTNFSLQAMGNVASEAVSGSKIAPDVFRGRVIASGEFSAFFENVTLRDQFVNETEVSLVAAFTTSALAGADFLSLSMPRIKLGGAGKDDPETGIRQRIPFRVLYNPSGGSGNKHEQTTLAIQDSAAP